MSNTSQPLPPDAFDPNAAPVGIVTYRVIGRTIGLTIPKAVRESLDWEEGDRIVVRATERGNVILRRVQTRQDREALDKERKGRTTHAHLT